MIRRKRKAKRRPSRRRRPRFLVFFLLLILLIGAGAYVLSLPIWKISDVVVNGTKILSPNEIRTLAGIPLSENLFYASFLRTKANLKNIPAIKKFRIYRIPPGTVLISIVERKPIASMLFSKKSIIIDEEGYVLNLNPNIRLNIANMADLAVVSGISEKRALEGERIDPKIARVVSGIILKLSNFLESKSMQVELGGLENVSFLLDDLLRVKLGNAKDMKRKMRVFDALLPEIVGKWSRIEYVDVRFPDNPVIKYR